MFLQENYMSEQHNNTRLQDVQVRPPLTQTDSESVRKRNRETERVGRMERLWSHFSSSK
jgi:hypothetical protein